MKEKKLNMKLLFSIVLLIACTISITSCREKKEKTKKGYFDYGEEISKGIEKRLEGIQSDEGFIDLEDTTEAALKVVEYAKILKEEGKITEYFFTEKWGTVTFEFPDGGSMVYYPRYEGKLSGGEDDSQLTVVSVDGMDYITELGDKLARSCISPIEDLHEYSNVSFIGDSCKIDPITKLLKNADECRAIFWRGHGCPPFHVKGYDKPVTGFVIESTDKQYIKDKWYDDYKNQAISFTLPSLLGVEHVVITPKFVDKYLKKVDGGLFFTGTCYGCADEGVMANAFLKKGFDVYIGSTDSVAPDYSAKIMSRTANFLTYKGQDCQYYTIDQALEKALDRHEKDNEKPHATFILKERTGGEKFRIVPRQYYVHGTITESESNNPIPGVNITIKNKKYSWAEDIKCVTDKDGQFSAENVFEGENLVIFEKKGYQSPHYKIFPENEVVDGSNVVTFDRKMTGIYEQQLRLIAEKYDSWNLYNDPDFDRVAPKRYSLAVTDIDDNGRLELFLHSGWGSGSFSCFKLYEVNENLDGMNLYYNNYNREAGADIGYEQFDVYNYQDRNILIFKDNLREGWMHAEMTLLPAYLKNNEFKLQAIGKSVTETGLDSNNTRQSKTTYYNSEDKSITKAQFESLPETLYPGAKKGTMYFKWISDYHFSGNIIDDLNNSWNGFYVEWKQ